jgi:hypothetical protein
MAEACEPARVRRDAVGAFEYRIVDNNALPAATADAVLPEEDQRNSAGWNTWFEKGWNAFFNAERGPLIEGITEALVEHVDSELIKRDRHIGELQGENAELRAMLGDVVRKHAALHDDVAELKAQERDRCTREQVRGEYAVRLIEMKQQMSAAHTESERQQYHGALAERDARIEKLEMQVRMLCNFLSVSGHDLPRGV